MREKYTVMGIRKFNYKSKKSGSEYEACNLYASCSRSGVDGLACEAFFLRADKLSPDIKVGDTVCIFYNRFGSVDAVVKA